ncbi:hypothetical protein D3C86_1415440 [compost metagenome]
MESATDLVVDRQLGLYGPRRDQRAVDLVLFVELQGAAARQRQHQAAHPCPVPNLEARHHAALHVAPVQIVPGCARALPHVIEEVGGHSGFVGKVIRPIPPGRGRQDKFTVFGKERRDVVRVVALLAHHITGVAPVQGPAAPVPEHLGARHARDAVRVVERVAVTRHLHHAEAGLDLARVRLRRRRVRLGLAFRLVHLGRQRLGDILVPIVVGAHAPVCPGLGLHPQHGVDRGLDEVRDQRPQALFV